MSELPTITVAIPVYNRRDLILDCVRSALAQEVPGLEVVVVDNASTDGTWEVLAELSDPRLRLLRNERNIGLFGNLNRCCDVARAPLLRILCSDDRLPSGALARELALISDHRGVVVVSGAGTRRERSGRTRGSIGDYLPEGAYVGDDAAAAVVEYWLKTARNPLNFPSGVLVDAETIRAVGGFPEDMRMAGDLACYLAMLAHGALLVSRHDAATITVHDGQETVRLDRARSAAPIIEAARLVARHAAALRRRRRQGGSARIVGNIAYALLRRRRALMLARLRARLRMPLAFLLGLIEVPLFQAAFRVAPRHDAVYRAVAGPDGVACAPSRAPS